MQPDHRPDPIADSTKEWSRRELLGAGGACLVAAGIGASMVASVEAAASLDPAIATLATVARDMFPHRAVPQQMFDDFAVRQLGTADAAAAQMLRGGLQDLDRRAGGGYRALDASARTALLASVAGTPFFGTVRFAALVTLYSDPAVVRLFGYEGASFEKGGYLTRGYDDLRWLPDPD